MNFERLSEGIQLVKSLRSESNHKIQEKSLSFWISTKHFDFTSRLTKMNYDLDLWTDYDYLSYIKTKIS